MSQIIQHRRGSLSNIKSLNTNGPIHRGEVLVATGSLYISSGSLDSDNYHYSASIFFGGSLTTDGSNYRPLTSILSGSGLPAITVGSYGRALDGILWINTDDNKLYRLAADPTLDLAGVGNGINATGSHVEISGGSSEASGQIGAAEDSSYTDGLFTDFTTTTPVGTAVDRFNEILKALAPPPAPLLDDIDMDSLGTSVKLSFGASNGVTSYSNVDGTGGSTVDSNAVFNTSGTRRGAFGSSGPRTGTLNEDVSGDGPGNINFPANSFGDAELGTIKLHVNGVDLLTVDLTSTNNAIAQQNSNSSQISVSATKNAQFDDGTELDTFKSRTGTYSINPADQRQGYNFAKIIRSVGGTDTDSDFVEWVNDFDNNALAGSGQEMFEYTATGANQISGVTYHTAASIKFRTNISNAYRNTYTNGNAISFNPTNLGAATGVHITGSGVTDTINASGNSHALPALNNSADCEQQVIHLACTASYTANLYDPNDTQRITAQVTHPLKSNVVSTPSDQTGALIYKTTTNSSNNTENFQHESNRLADGNYANQSDAHSGNAFNSATSLATGGNTDLLVVPFDSGRVVAPAYNANGISNGNFAAITNGPGQNGQPGTNPNYSSLTGATLRSHYFKLRNTTTSDLSNMAFTIQGTGTGVLANKAGSAMSGNEFKLEFKGPQRTGWMDAVNDSTRTTPALQDGDQGSLAWSNPTTSGTSYTFTVHSEVLGGTLSTGNISGGEYIVFRITAREDWTGHIQNITTSSF